MITREEASRIAVQKAIELFGREKLNTLGGCWGVSSGVFVLNIGEPYEEDKNKCMSKVPVIDETIPWKKHTSISVNMKTGEVTVRQQENVTIFDGENAKYLKK